MPGATPVETIRFLIQDTDESQAFLTDEEILWMISTWGERGSVYYVAARCCQNIATKLAREVSFSSDSQSVSLSELTAKYQSLMVSYMETDNAMGVGELFVGGEGGPDSRGPSFGVGMHDDINVGPQYIRWDVWPHPEQWGTNVP